MPLGKVDEWDILDAPNVQNISLNLRREPIGVDARKITYVRTAYPCNAFQRVPLVNEQCSCAIMQFNSEPEIRKLGLQLRPLSLQINRIKSYTAYTDLGYIE